MKRIEKKIRETEEKKKMSKRVTTRLKYYTCWIVPWIVNHKKHKDLRKCSDGSEFVALFSLIILVKKSCHFFEK
jgi:hypothetical protein